MFRLGARGIQWKRGEIKVRLNESWWQVWLCQRQRKMLLRRTPSVQSTPGPITNLDNVRMRFHLKCLLVLRLPTQTQQLRYVAIASLVTMADTEGLQRLSVPSGVRPACPIP